MTIIASTGTRMAVTIFSPRSKLSLTAAPNGIV